MTDGSGNQHHFSYDGLGSLSDLTDGTGAVTDTFAYDVFGAVTTRTGTTPNVWTRRAGVHPRRRPSL